MMLYNIEISKSECYPSDSGLLIREYSALFYPLSDVRHSFLTTLIVSRVLLYHVHDVWRNHIVCLLMHKI